jgi:hypothetical protein
LINDFNRISCNAVCPHPIQACVPGELHGARSKRAEGLMKISMGSWAFSFGPYSDQPVPFEDTVRRLSEAGYDGIEICGFPPHVTVENYPDSESRKELVNFLQTSKLGFPAIRQT